MNRKYLAFVSALALVIAAPAFANVKIATVSMERLFDGYYKREEAFDRLSSVQRQAQEEAEERAAPLQRMQEELQELEERAENQLLSDEARADLMQEFNMKLQRLQQAAQEHRRWEQQKMQELQQRQQTIRMNLIEEIRDVVLAVAREDGVELVFDTSDVTGSGVPSVLYASSGFDMTDKVMRELNRGAP
ncbi:MAG: OmpH family outer membrane protein [Opitutales bacterium]|nr:OmpH family outer membrane protein [Opitutales bacterium]